MRRTLLTLATLLACDPDDAGTAPVLGDAQVASTTITVGTSNTIEGQASFTDEDADVDTLELTIVTPSGERSTMDVEVADAAGKSAGTVTFVIAIAPPAAGSYGLELVLIDAEGNASNAEKVTLTAS